MTTSGTAATTAPRAAALTPAAPAVQPPQAGQPVLATPAPRPAPKPGDIVLSDSFDNPANGVLPRSVPADYYSVGYSDGEYVIKQTAPSSFLPFASMPGGTYTDATLAVDARVFGDPAGRSLVLSCRTSGAGYYRFSLIFPDRRFLLIRVNGQTQQTTLSSGTNPAVRPGIEWNRMELTCQGSTISASVNGVQVASVQDSSFERGGMHIGAASGSATLLVEARFDNLVVTQR